MISNGARLARASRTASMMSASLAAEIRLMRSEARQVCERQTAVLDVHVSLFDAGGQSGKDLSRIEQTIGVESAFQTLLLRKISFAEHGRHQFALFQTHAMFAGQDAAHFDAESEDGGAKRFGALKLVALHHVEDDERVKVAVAGMKDRKSTRLNS